MQKRTLLYRLVGDIYVAVHSERTPTDEDWNAYFADLDKHINEFRGIYVHSPGGGPNSAQREKATKFFEGREVRVAIVTSAAVVRGIVTAIHWFMGNKIKAFSPNHTAEALNFLQVTDPLQRRALDDTVRRMRDELSGGQSQASTNA